jgi:hypothetical protein
MAWDVGEAGNDQQVAALEADVYTNDLGLGANDLPVDDGDGVMPSWSLTT